MNKKNHNIIGSGGTSTANAGTWTSSNHVPYNNFNINNIHDHLFNNNSLSSTSSSFCLPITVGTINRVENIAVEEIVGVASNVPATSTSISPLITNYFHPSNSPSSLNSIDTHRSRIDNLVNLEKDTDHSKALSVDKTGGISSRKKKKNRPLSTFRLRNTGKQTVDLCKKIIV